VGAAADRIGQAADRVPSAEALAVAYWHGAVMGVCVALAVVCVVCACMAVWRGSSK
jgi:Na+/H+-translocating membrane pyrophosphatase